VRRVAVSAPRGVRRTDEPTNAHVVIASLVSNHAMLHAIVS